MATQFSTQMDGASVTTPSDDLVKYDDNSVSLPLHVPKDVQTYYEIICKIQPLARRNFIIKQLWIVGVPYSESQEKYDYVVAEVAHLRGHDISNHLKYLVIENSVYSPFGSSSSATHIVSQSRGADGDRNGASTSRNLTLISSSDSNLRKICLLEELFRIVTIVSKNAHLYSTNIDASFWFATTIMETVQANFPPPPQTHYGEHWLKRIIRSLNCRSNLYKPQSESGRQIVAAYRADKKKNPNSTPLSTGSQSLSVKRSAIRYAKPWAKKETMTAVVEATVFPPEIQSYSEDNDNFSIRQMTTGTLASLEKGPVKAPAVVEAKVFPPEIQSDLEDNGNFSIRHMTSGTLASLEKSTVKAPAVMEAKVFPPEIQSDSEDNGNFSIRRITTLASLEKGTVMAPQGRQGQGTVSNTNSRFYGPTA